MKINLVAITSAYRDVIATVVFMLSNSIMAMQNVHNI